MPIELIKWEDHSGGRMSWTDVAEIITDIDAPYTIETVGHVLAENKHRLVLVQNLAINDNANHSMNIMKRNIISRKVLRK